MKLHGVQLLGERELFVLKILRNVRERKVLYVSMSKDKKLFTIDSNIDKEEFMADIKKEKIPIKSYWVNKYKMTKIL